MRIYEKDHKGRSGFVWEHRGGYVAGFVDKPQHLVDIAPKVGFALYRNHWADEEKQRRDAFLRAAESPCADLEHLEDLARRERAMSRLLERFQREAVRVTRAFLDSREENTFQHHS